MATRRIFSTVFLIGLLLGGILLSATCKESASSPTGPGVATLSGNVVSGDAVSGPQGSGLAGLTVRATRTGQSTMTDSSGDFLLTGIPAGSQELEFSRGDINARGSISVAAGTTVAITASILRKNTVVLSPRQGFAPGTPNPTHGPSVAEIEGVVTAVSLSGNGSLTIFDERLGTVVVNLTATTTITKGNKPVTLSDILVGMRVHVKAMLVSGNTYTAIEVTVQDEKTKTVTPAAPTRTPTQTPNTPTPTPT